MAKPHYTTHIQLCSVKPFLSALVYCLSTVPCRSAGYSSSESTEPWAKRKYRQMAALSHTFCCLYFCITSSEYILQGVWDLSSSLSFILLGLLALTWVILGLNTSKTPLPDQSFCFSDPLCLSLPKVISSILIFIPFPA